MQSQPESRPQRNSLAVLVLCGAALLTVTIGLDQSPLSVVEPTSVPTPDHRHVRPGIRIGKTHYQLINPTSDRLSALRSQPNQVEVLQVFDIPFDEEQAYEFPPEIFQTISRLHNLRTLVIAIDRIGDDAVQAIMKLNKLQAVVFYDAHIDQEQLLKLARHRKLKLVGLWLPTATPVGIDHFRAAAPHIQLEIGEYNRYGDVFDQNGCLNSRFIKAWFR